MATATKLITAEEFMAMDLGEGRYELVRGVVVDVALPSPDNRTSRFRSGFLLEKFRRRTGLGDVVNHVSSIVTNRGPDTVRGAVAAFYSQARCSRDKLGPGLTPVPPDLVVEVFWPEDKAHDTRRKINEYLDAGVRLVWVLHLTRRQLLMFREDALLPMVYELNDIVENLPELPGFRCVVSEFFA